MTTTTSRPVGRDHAGDTDIATAWPRGGRPLVGTAGGTDVATARSRGGGPLAGVCRVLVLVVAGLELCLALWAYRARLTETDWVALAHVLPALGDDEAIVWAQPWLEPSARQHLDTMAVQALRGRADGWGIRRVHLVLLRREPVSEDWTRELPANTRLEAAGTEVSGPWIIHHYSVAGFRPELATLVDPSHLEVFIDGERCRIDRRTSRWTCRHAGSVLERIVEVDGAARRCLVLDTADDTEVILRRRAMPTGDRLRGHIGFTDFNGVLRNDTPIRVELSVDDSVRLRMVATDEEGWIPFEVAAASGTHDVEIRLALPRQGQWSAGGYRTSPSRAPCVELRSFGPETSS